MNKQILENKFAIFTDEELDAIMMWCEDHEVGKLQCREQEKWHNLAVCESMSKLLDSECVARKKSSSTDLPVEIKNEHSIFNEHFILNFKPKNKL